jgi:hypothetical protein
MELVRWALPTQFDSVLEFGIAGGVVGFYCEINGDLGLKIGI